MHVALLKRAGVTVLMPRLYNWGSSVKMAPNFAPDIVWFGEDVEYLEESRRHIATAAKVLVVGTSLTVFPAASLVRAARGRAEKILVALAMDKLPYGFRFMRGKASSIVPFLCQGWLTEHQNEDRYPDSDAPVS